MYFNMLVWAPVQRLQPEHEQVAASTTSIMVHWQPESTYQLLLIVGYFCITSILVGDSHLVILSFLLENDFFVRVEIQIFLSA